MAAICNVCGLPDELCICQEIAKEQQKAIISTERRRYGKFVTKWRALTTQQLTSINLQETLKNKCAAGGTVKGRLIELQGITRKKLQKCSRTTDSMWRCDEMDIYNHSWLGRTLTVTASTDASLTGRQGLVIDETPTPLRCWKANTPSS